MINSSGAILTLDLSSITVFEADAESVYQKSVEANRKAYSGAKAPRVKKLGRPKKDKDARYAWVGNVDKNTGKHIPKKKYKHKKYIPKPKRVWIKNNYTVKFVSEAVAAKHYTQIKRKRYHYPEKILPLITVSENVTHEGSTFYSVKGNRQKVQKKKRVAKKSLPKSKEELRIYAREYYTKNREKILTTARQKYQDKLKTK